MKKNEIFLKDYKSPDFKFNSVHLVFDIEDESALVSSTIECVRLSDQETALVLHGKELELTKVLIDDVELSRDAYEVDPQKLIIKNTPESFKLEIVTNINPYKNLSGEGLYKSGKILCTQCEAEGFRRITYFLDRPDVLTKYSTKIIADKKEYPVLLSNGDLTEAGELDGGRHFATWNDPFNKPSYLFALVAGDLALVQDTYTTKSGKQVSLDFYVDPGNEDKCFHAIESLKNSMKWDEDTFGLEYDLNTYMVVAVDSFNMGAMENKGLNIFNSAYVLAKKETATDDDFMGIESVIGHEYFHNWTGNRVTCRDWFQLTLKEGLTVFRDQEFSADMLSRPVKRIEDVIALKAHQFVEDAGPLSHPIKPKSFVEINNFYTSTIYEKGAEVIRMIHTILGKDNFRKGMDLYFKRHDGHAVTTEDFIGAMADASGVDLKQFMAWYDQNGTPTIDIKYTYDEKLGKVVFSFHQKAKTNNEEFKSLHIPLKYTLYSKNGEIIGPEGNLFELKNEINTLEFEGLSELPMLSINEGFTAPVHIKFHGDLNNSLFMMKHCKDTFNKFNATQNVLESEILRISKIKKPKNSDVNLEVIEAYKNIYLDESLDLSFKVMALSIPGLKEINDRLEKFEFENLKSAVNVFKSAIGDALEDEALKVIQNFNLEKDYEYNAQLIGERSFALLSYRLLAYTKNNTYSEIMKKAYYGATNMTVEFGLLSMLLNYFPEETEKESKHFYNKWKHETLVIQKWLKLNAQLESTDTSKISELELLPVYDEKIPNLVRSLIGAFMRFNFWNFHAEDGSGYEFIKEQIIKIDNINPQIAAGITRGLNFKNKHTGNRKDKIIGVLKSLTQNDSLSSDVQEIAQINLK